MCPLAKTEIAMLSKILFLTNKMKMITKTRNLLIAYAERGASDQDLFLMVIEFFSRTTNQRSMKL